MVPGCVAGSGKEEEMPMSAAIDNTVCCSPCLVLGGFDGSVARSFRRRGWDVYQTKSGPEARRLARMVSADLIVLDTFLPEESGWLTCEKLTREIPGARVVLVDPDPRRAALAEFVGAAALVGSDGLAALLELDPVEALSSTNG
jgi:ActR/RegA family two-component response regulator